MFEIPIALFLFRRTSTLSQIIGRINEINPRIVYLIADGGRTKEEQLECESCREYAKSLLDESIQVVENFSDENRGVYANIGLGAKWVLERERWAIFLEDDNLPSLSFFPYCKELLEKYESEEQVLWVCGTNYLGDYKTEYSYVFTRHMLPCGWASWSDKYLRYYDGDLTKLNDKEYLKRFKKSYLQKDCKSLKLYYTQLYSIKRTKYLIDNCAKSASWDYQMNYSVRSNLFYGISPCVNQINNIGVDNFSIHGGNISEGQISIFCNVEEKTIDFPLKHPPMIRLDEEYETKINEILAPNWSVPIKHAISKPIKRIIGIGEYDSLAQKIKQFKHKSK